MNRNNKKIQKIRQEKEKENDEDEWKKQIVDPFNSVFALENL